MGRGDWSEREAIEEYRRTHWGRTGNEAIDESEAPDPRIGTFVLLGRLFSVTYETMKGRDQRFELYEHEFSRPYPALVYNAQGLVIARYGSRYRVKPGGITG